MSRREAGPVRDETGRRSWASSPSVRARMRRQRTKDTSPEISLRKALHALGLRYRVHRSVLPGSRQVPDIVFGPSRVAVFVDGCFWHACPRHYQAPKANADYWVPKITRNRERDRETDAALAAMGWLAIRVWEHEPPADAAMRIASWVERRRRGTARDGAGG